MKVKFFDDADTRYGRIKAGKAVTVSKQDGDAYIANGKAKLATTKPKEAKKDV